MATQYAKISEEWIGDPDTCTAGLEAPTGLQAAEIYKRAVHRFGQDLTHDQGKTNWAGESSSLQHLQDIVSTARKDYESSRNKKCRKWLERFSGGLMYYTNVFDALAQHHPEYVALAWGAMKFLFVALLNHENAVSYLPNPSPESQMPFHVLDWQ